jgi:predicted transcriptional regulator
MPRPGPRRPLVAVRLSQADIDALDRIAAEEDVTRSVLIRKAVVDMLVARAAGKSSQVVLDSKP